MGALGIIDRIAGLFTRRAAEAAQNWAEWADENPGPAAIALDRRAGKLEARARSRRRQNSWGVRRLRAKAASLRKQAQGFRIRAKGCS